MSEESNQISASDTHVNQANESVNQRTPNEQPPPYTEAINSPILPPKPYTELPSTSKRKMNFIDIFKKKFFFRCIS